MDREALSTRIAAFLFISYCLICFTTVVYGMIGGHGNPWGFLAPLWFGFYHFASSIDDSILRFILKGIAIIAILVFLPGILGGMLLFLALLLILLIPGLIVGLAVSLAHVSITGAFIVFAIIGIVFTVLIRNYWESIAEAIAWLSVLTEGLRARFTMPAGSPIGGALVALVPFQKKGNISTMSRRFDPSDPSDVPATRDDDTPQPLNPLQPLNAITAISSGIRARLTKKALDDHAEMVGGANRVQQQYIEQHKLQTDWNNRNFVRKETTAKQELKTDQAVDQLEDYRAERDMKMALPKNPIDRMYETEFKPRQAGDIRKPLDQATTRVETIIEAAAALKKHEKDIDDGPFTDDEKETLKNRIRAEFRAILGTETPK